MAKESVTLFYELCRLCLKTPGDHLIHESENTLPDDIFAFAGVRVSAADNLPDKICQKCMNTIYDMKALRKLAIDNDTHLRFLFGDEDNQLNDSSKNNLYNNAKSSQQLMENDQVNSKSGIKSYKDSDSGSDSPKPLMIFVRKDLFHKSEEDSKATSCEIVKTKVETTPIKRENTPQDGVIYKCPECPKVFYESKKFYLHKRQHNKCFSCPIDVCEKRFPTKNDLKKHLRVHTGERPFQCPNCGKRFKQGGTLKQHIELVHQEET